jgi:nucleotide-binding universal stress UspA family protein
MKDVLAIITPVYSDALGQAAHYAFALAGLSGAHVTILITEIVPDSPARMSEPDLMQAGVEVAEPPSTKERVARTIALVQGAATRANVACTVLSEPRSSDRREILIDSAQVRDVVIVDVPGPLRQPRQEIVEAVLFGSGRPIILVPPNVQAPAAERALVAWDGTRSATRALHDALPVLTHVRREVVVVTVADDKELRPSRSGDEVCRYLGRWGAQARFELLQRGSRNVGDVLLGRAAEIEAGLVVMGGFGHAREREFLFGSATRDIFQSTLKMAVLLSH